MSIISVEALAAHDGYAAVVQLPGGLADGFAAFFGLRHTLPS